MPKTYPVAKPVQAIPCYAILGVYVPEEGVEVSEAHLLVSTEHVAGKVCETLNGDPQAYVEGLHGAAKEYIAKFRYERFLVYPSAKKDIHTSYASAMAFIKKIR